MSKSHHQKAFWADCGTMYDANICVLRYSVAMYTLWINARCDGIVDCASTYLANVCVLWYNVALYMWWINVDVAIELYILHQCILQIYVCCDMMLHCIVYVAHQYIFIGKVVFICLRVSVNLVYKFQGKPSTTTVKHNFNPNGLKFHRGSPWVSILSWLNLKANKDYFSYEYVAIELYIVHQFMLQMYVCCDIMLLCICCESLHVAIEL